MDNTEIPQDVKDIIASELQIWLTKNGYTDNESLITNWAERAFGYAALFGYHLRDAEVENHVLFLEKLKADINDMYDEQYKYALEIDGLKKEIEEKGLSYAALADQFKLLADKLIAKDKEVEQLKNIIYFNTL